MFVRLAHWSRRRPVTQASSECRCLVSGRTLRTLQQSRRRSTAVLKRSTPCLPVIAAISSASGSTSSRLQARVAGAEAVGELERLGRQPAGVDAEDRDRPGRSRTPCRSARRCRSGTTSRSRGPARTGRSPTRGRACGSSPSNSIESSPASSSSINSIGCSSLRPPPPRVVVFGRLEAGQLLRARRRSRGARTTAKLSSGSRRSSQPGDQPLDRRVELVGRHAPEERACRSRARARGCRARRCRRPGGARRPRRATVVPWKPRSPTQCWAQACGQPSRCSRSVGDLRRRSAPRGGRSARPRRVFVSATEKLQCGSPVQAIELPRTGLMSSGKPIALELGDRLVEPSRSGRR